MNAHQARIKTEKGISDKIEKNLLQVYDIIKRRAEDGKYDTSIKNLRLEPFQLEELREKGYKVNFSKREHDYETELFISWKEEEGS